MKKSIFWSIWIIIKKVMLMKKLIVIMVATLILGFFTGVYLYKINRVDETQKEAKAILVEDECTEFAEKGIVNANSQEKKVSVNTILTIKILYKKCNHIIQTSEKITDNSAINLTEDKFKEKYSEWEIQKFTPNEIVIYKEVDDFCDEHYKLKDEDGYIAIYKIDKKGNEIIYRMTEIKLEYLTEEDITKIRNGILVYSKKELNTVLEDFE